MTPAHETLIAHLLEQIALLKRQVDNLAILNERLAARVREGK